MKYKKEIEKLLFDLKINNIERDKIEQELNYSENYIDQVLAKGGNKRFYTALKKYSEMILQNAISEKTKEDYKKDQNKIKQEVKEYTQHHTENILSDYKEKYLTALEEIRELQKKLLEKKEKTEESHRLLKRAK